MKHSRLPSSHRRHAILASVLYALTVTLSNAAPLDPTAFTSRGPSPFVSGTYQVDTSFDNPAPTIRQGVSVIATGIFYDPTPANTANRDEIAVFTFDTIDLPQGVTLAGLRNANSRPVAFLSKDAMTVGGLIDFSGAQGESTDGLNGGIGGAAGPGGGGGGGGGGAFDSETLMWGTGGSGGVGFVSGYAGESSGGGGVGGSVETDGGGLSSADGAGGGAFGGNGGNGFPSLGGTAYGDLTARLEGGSGGGGGEWVSSGGSGGGGGGGAVELGAASTLSLYGRLTTQGGAVEDGVAGGGGAGGGIILHADSVVIDSAGSIDASGGAGAIFAGSGGGGRVLIVANTIITSGLATAINVAGGGSGEFASPGSNGVVSIIGTVDTPPQILCPQSTSISCAAASGLSVTLSVFVSDANPSQTLTLTLKEGSTVLGTKSASTPATNLLVAFDPVMLSATAHALTVEVTDGILTTSCTTSATVDADTNSPVPDISILPTIIGQCSASLSTVPTATDACAGKIKGTTTDALSYNTQGTFTIHWTYDDGRGNTTVQTQSVIVRDNVAPVPDLAILPTITGQCSASVTNPPTATDACAGKINGTTTDPRSYNTQGTFTIRWTFDDGRGNTTNQTQTVIVQDTLAPTITACPSNQNANATSPTGALVNYPAAIASDSCASPILSYSKASGTLFPIGDTTVTVTATDVAGHQVTCSFNVHVKGATEQLFDLRAYLASLSIDSGIKLSLQSKLAAAQAALASGNPQNALTALQDFINATLAVKGKKLTAAQTSRLISDATRIRGVIRG